jgi:glycosyltransferase involved in cell wall biosynthesis
MHIVHCLTHSTYGGGQEVPFLLIKNLLKFYPSISHTVILPPNGVFVKRFRDLNISVIEFPFNKLSVKSFFEIRSLLKSLKPDIVHTHGRGAGLYLQLISPKALPAKRFHTHHGFHVPVNQVLQFIFRVTERFLSQNVDRIISVSLSEAGIIAGILPASDSKIKIIPNIVDNEDIHRRAKLTDATLVENTIPETKDLFTIIMIGRNDSVKNYPLAFRTAENVLTKEKDIAFIFVGINSDDADFALLKKQFPQQCYAIGFIENPLPLIAQSSLLLLTSKREGAPLTVLEAFVLGKPVIGTKVRGISDVVIHEENGLLVEEESTSIAGAIARIKADSRLYKKLSEGAVNSGKKMSVDQWVGEYYSSYHSIVKES